MIWDVFIMMAYYCIFILIFHRRLWEESIEENQVDDGERSTRPGNDNNDHDDDASFDH